MSIYLFIGCLFSRWGPNSKETAAIKKYLETQNVDTRAHPLVGGLEVDLPALYHAVQVVTTYFELKPLPWWYFSCHPVYAIIKLMLLLC